jgi:hypothetical protein
MVIEAEVQPKRLTRAYHRRWHRDHGRALVALLGQGETFDSRMLPIPIPPGRRTLFGAAPWAYRIAVVSAARAVGAWLRRRGDEAFQHECEFLEATGHILGCARREVRVGSVARPAWPVP